MSGRTDRLTLLLVLHNHQPVGNLPEVFRQTYDSAYLPMVDLLERHPTVRAALHYTGPLLEWLQQEEPSFLMRLEALQASGQVEIMGGALYEPILAVIPDADKQGQLEA
ncbi:MAG: alpha-amylase, partial [Anaerolineae bacterium]|nr:alpha-amylase [Anaerolineae bacterium]